MEMEAEKGMQQAFGSPGGKSYLARKIASELPEHKVYVEPYAGGAAVYFRKGASEKEVLGDRDTEIAFAFRFLRDMTDEQYKRLEQKDWVISQKQFDKLKASEPTDDVERFYRFYYIKKGSFGRISEYVNKGKIGYTIGIDKLPKVHKRLKGTAVHTGDALKLIDKYDSKDTFFYLDPPYPGRASTGKGAPEFTEEDLKKLTDRLKHIKGKFMLSLSTEHAKLLPSGWNVKRVKVGRNVAGRAWAETKGTSSSYQYEIIATNFRFSKNRQGLTVSKGLPRRIRHTNRRRKSASSSRRRRATFKRVKK